MSEQAFIYPSRFHVGLHPYIDAYGTKCASYEWLNDAGRAIGIVSIENGIPVDMRSLPDCDTRAFTQCACHHFKHASPAVFGKS